MVQVNHIIYAIPEIWGRFTFRREPAELRGVVQSTNGAGVVQLRVELVGLLHDIMSQFAVRLVPPNEVVQTSKQQHVQGPRILKHFNFCSAWSRSQVRNQRFGPKQNTKLTGKNHPPPTTHPAPTTHLPKTFRTVPGFVWGQDSVRRLPIDQRAMTPNFAPYLK